jgi:hypothetical protein
MDRDTYDRLLSFVEGDDPNRVRKIGALVIHGMGTPEFSPAWPKPRQAYNPDREHTPAFHLPMARKIAKRIRVSHSSLDPLDIAWQPIDYHKVLAPQQHRYLRRIASGTRWDSLRSFTLSALGDAAAYDYRDESDGAVYKQIQTAIHEAIGALAARIEPGAPIVLFANSLGGAVITDYIWDRQNWGQGHDAAASDEDDPTPDPFAAGAIDLTTQLTGVVTFGCNIPIFAHANTPVRAIDFPDRLPAEYRRVARWLNINDKDDVLGFPLIELGDDYEAMSNKINGDGKSILEDLPVNTDWIPWLGTPFSHMSYWTDDDFIRPSAELVARILEIA